MQLDRLFQLLLQLHSQARFSCRDLRVVSQETYIPSFVLENPIDTFTIIIIEKALDIFSQRHEIPRNTLLLPTPEQGLESHRGLCDSQPLSLQGWRIASPERIYHQLCKLLGVIIFQLTPNSITILMALHILFHCLYEREPTTNQVKLFIQDQEQELNPIILLQG